MVQTYNSRDENSLGQIDMNIEVDRKQPKVDQNR